MRRKKVLVTGAAGFLGSHLCDKFIKEGYAVIGMDNLITGDARLYQAASRDFTRIAWIQDYQ